MVDLDEVTKPKKKWGTTFSAALLAVLIMLVAALIVIVIIKLEKNCDKCVTCEESSPSCSSNTVEPLYFTLVSTKVNYTDAINGNYTNVLQSLSSQIHDALTNPAVRSRSAAFTNFDGSNSNILPVAILGISPSPTGFGVVVIGSTVVTGQNLLSPQDATNRLTSHNLTAYVITSQPKFNSPSAYTVTDNDNFHATANNYIHSYINDINTSSDLSHLHLSKLSNATTDTTAITLPDNIYAFLRNPIDCHTASFFFFFFFFSTIYFVIFVNINDFDFLLIVSNFINNNNITVSFNDNGLISKPGFFSVTVSVNIICNNPKLFIFSIPRSIFKRSIIGCLQHFHVHGRNVCSNSKLFIFSSFEFFSTVHIHLLSYFDFDDSNNNMFPSTNAKPPISLPSKYNSITGCVRRNDSGKLFATTAVYC
uniref:Uncharacterized protein n=1 Tax=Plectus sambesii TaxID=2011161 RepID=A0A914X339_9BILA